MSTPSSSAHRSLGRSGLMVSELGFGAAPIGDLYGKLDETVAIDTVAYAIESGMSLADTSPHYGNGLAEHRVGTAIRRAGRERVVLSTKMGRWMTPSHTPPNWGGFLGGAPFARYCQVAEVSTNIGNLTVPARVMPHRSLRAGEWPGSDDTDTADAYWSRPPSPASRGSMADVSPPEPSAPSRTKSPFTSRSPTATCCSRDRSHSAFADHAAKPRCRVSPSMHQGLAAPEQS